MPLRIGDQAPDFTLENQFGRTFKLSDELRKNAVLIAFYPLDWTPT